MPFATNNGVRLYFQEQGEGEPLLLVSGQGGDHRGWDLVRDDFSERYRTISFDHRGTGESDKPDDPSGYSTRNFANDAIAILDHLGIERAHAYGVSMGGRICQWLGIEHADRVGALVLGCTTPGNAHGVRRPAEVDRYMANRPEDPEEAIRVLSEQMVSPEYLDANPAYLEYRRERMLHPIPAFAQKLHYAASEGHDAWDGLPSITAPVLVIHGTEDNVNPSANAPLLANRIPNAELCWIDGGRHGYFIEFREQASAAVLDFLARHPLATIAPG